MELLKSFIACMTNISPVTLKQISFNTPDFA